MVATLGDKEQSKGADSFQQLAWPCKIGRRYIILRLFLQEKEKWSFHSMSQNFSTLTQGKGTSGSQQPVWFCDTGRRCSMLRLGHHEGGRGVECASTVTVFQCTASGKGYEAYCDQHISETKNSYTFNPPGGKKRNKMHTIIEKFQEFPRISSQSDW